MNFENMEQNHPHDPHPLPQGSEPFGNVPHSSERFGNVRNDSESFRNIPKASEDFGTLPHALERKESHTLTVREAARMFEAAGVARTERSITNWCQPTHGIARLDAYFDPNERKYFITPQSVESAISEEKAKAAKINSPSEPFGNVPKGSEEIPQTSRKASEGEESDADSEELERQIRDLQINNRAKDLFIDRLEKEREAFAEERKSFVEKLIASSRHIGELETKLLQLGSPRPGNREHPNPE